jgi:AcrR family transcriptional regulator
MHGIRKRNVWTARTRRELRKTMSEQVHAADGRTARRLGNRVRILDALFALIREGTYHPTLKQIAARAGVTARTLLNHFPDLGSLLMAAAQHGRRQAESSLPELPSTGDPERRVREFFRRAAGFYDAFAAIRWSTLTTNANLPGFDPNKHKSVVWGRLSERIAKLVGNFEVELSRPARRALLVVTDPIAWRLLRVQQGLSRADAAEALALSVIALARGEAVRKPTGSAGSRRDAEAVSGNARRAGPAPKTRRTASSK